MLFSLPEAWLGFFSYGKLVPGHIMGQPDKDWVRPALSVLSASWVSAIPVLQAMVRRLTSGGKPSLDMGTLGGARAFSERLHEISRRKGAPAHVQFVEACEKLKLPVADGEALVASSLTSLGGGRFSEEGERLELGPTRSRELFWLGLALLAQPRWTSTKARNWCSMLYPAIMCRSPLQAILQEVLWLAAHGWLRRCSRGLPPAGR